MLKTDVTSIAKPNDRRSGLLVDLMIAKIINIKPIPTDDRIINARTLNLPINPSTLEKGSTFSSNNDPISTQTGRIVR